MKRRLRKKLRIGEYQEYGFGVTADLRPNLSDDEVKAFMHRIIDAIEARHLGIGGGAGEDRFQGFISRFERGSATEDDRAALKALLAADKDVVSHEVGTLEDAWR